jgi:lysozyme
MSETHVIGVDVSVHQGRLREENWKRAAAAGVRFAWARVADGMTHLDDTFGENVQGMQAAGVLAGGYLFFRATRDPLEQARLLVSQAARLDLPPALDCEERSDMGLPREVVREKVRLCLEEIERLAGRVIVYTAIGWWEPWMGPQPMPYDLWVAHYGVERPRIPTAFLAQGWRFWQESPKGIVDGLPRSGVDLNRWAGTEEELRRYCGRTC